MPRVTVEDEEIRDYLYCPICFTIPEAEVYQCRDGHLMCKKCYVKLKECPQCRIPLDSVNPIRNRHFETLLDELKVNCCFKSNGCDLVLKRGLMRVHQNTCFYDFKKFGKFLNICALIGFANCDFGVNNGNGKEAVDHFVKDHNCILTNQADGFEIEHSGFTKTKEDQIWTPIILNLKDKLCYLLIVAITFQLEDSIAWFAIFLPYPKHSSKALVQLEMSFVREDDFPQCRFLLEPFTLAKAVNVIPEGLYRMQISSLNSHFLSKDGSLRMICKILAKRNKKGNKMEVFTCQKVNSGGNIKALIAPTLTPKRYENPFVTKSSPNNVGVKQKSKYTARNSTQEGKKKSCSFWPVMLTILGVCLSGSLINHVLKEVEESPSFVQLKLEIPIENLGIMNKNVKNVEEVEKIVQVKKEELKAKIADIVEAKKELIEEQAKLLKVRLLSKLALNGEVENLQEFLKSKGDFDINFIDQGFGYPPLYLVTKDKDKNRGLEKAKLLVWSGALIRHPGVDSSILLHLAALGGNKEMLEYFIKEGNFHAKVNAKDEEGNTPLHMAMMNEDEEDSLDIAEALIGLGARCDVKNIKGVTPLQVGFVMNRNKEKLERMCRMRIEF